MSDYLVESKLSVFPQGSSSSSFVAGNLVIDLANFFCVSSGDGIKLVNVGAKSTEGLAGVVLESITMSLSWNLNSTNGIDDIITYMVDTGSESSRPPQSSPDAIWMSDEIGAVNESGSATFVWTNPNKLALDSIGSQGLFTIFLKHNVGSDSDSGSLSITQLDLVVPPEPTFWAGFSIAKERYL